MPAAVRRVAFRGELRLQIGVNRAFQVAFLVSRTRTGIEDYRVHA
jgi:hypothetical protein